MTDARCYACRSPRIERRHLEAPAPEVVVCAECGHAVRAEARALGDNLSIQHEVFEAKASAPAGPARWPGRQALLARTVNRLAGRPGATLDIGCSNGAWLAALGVGWERHGVELSPAAAEIARTFAGARVHCGAIETFDAPADAYDLVTAFALVEHLVDPRALVSWAFRHLRPGGLLVLMTGDRESRVAARMGGGWPLYAPVEHVHFFSARSLAHLLRQAGFALVRREWRFMGYPELRVSALGRVAEKAREIAGLVGEPRSDHLYVYARKPAERPLAPAARASG